MDKRPMVYVDKRFAPTMRPASFSPLRIDAAPWNNKLDGCKNEGEKEFVTTTSATFCYIERIQLTRAQWLWLLNFVCFLAHQGMAILCYTACNRADMCTPEGMTIKTHRIVSNWTNPGINGYSKEVVENSLPVPLRYDILAGSFFQLSALFHGVWVVLGILEIAGLQFAATIACRIYYNYIDDALCYWRCARALSRILHLLIVNRPFSNHPPPHPRRRSWIEYALSAPVMLVCLSLVVGITEINAVLTLFVLMSNVMVCGLFTEMYSRPTLGPSVKYAKFYKGKRGWQGDETHGRRLNYFRRMLPHIYGILPYTLCWTIYIRYFIVSLDDAAVHYPDIWELIPPWVIPAILSTAGIFTTFTFVQIYYQWVSPDCYWRTEIWYGFLSLTSKMVLGILLYINILRFANFDAAIALVPRNTTNG